MSKNHRLIECVPNFSEGRDASIIEKIVESISAVPDVQVLHVDMGADANRTVISFVGSPEGIEEAAFLALQCAAELIDMRHHRGTHPRIGATDVMPLIPLSGVTMADVVAIAARLTQRVGSALHIPVFNYEKSARYAYRRQLEQIRRGQYEGLEEKMKDAAWQADNAIPFNPKTGATVLGARSFLLAYNVNLATRDVTIAKAIAANIRESGKIVNGKRIAGQFKGLKAIGWEVPEYGLVQVSTKLIGLIPKACLLASGIYYAPQSRSEPELIAHAIDALGLKEVDDFCPEHRIIEYLLK